MNLLSRIKEWLKGRVIVSDDGIIPVPTSTHQVDQRDIETRKRVKKAFEAQKAQMEARAMKAHDVTCGNIQDCKKKKCFKWEPDKIVSEPKEVKRGDPL